MAQYTINIGALPNDGTGDPLRTAFNETNLNFNQLFAAGPAGSNISIANNTIQATNTNGNIVLATNGIGVVVAGASVVPDRQNVRNLGAGLNRFNTVYAQYLDATSIAVAGNAYVAGNLFVTGNTITANVSDLNIANSVITVAADSPYPALSDGAGISVGGTNATLTYGAILNGWVSNLPFSAPVFIGDGSQLTNVAANASAETLSGNMLANTIVTSSLTSVGVLTGLTVAGNATVSNTLTSGTVTATNLYGTNISGNGAGLTALTASAIRGEVANATWANYAGTAMTANLAALATQAVNADSALVAVNAQYAGNANVATYAATANTAVYARAATLANSAIVAGRAETIDVQTSITVTGNIRAGGILTDNYFYANGVPVAFSGNIISNYSNANVAAYLPTYTGNVGAENVISNNIYANSYFYANGTPFIGGANTGVLGDQQFYGNNSTGPYTLNLSTTTNNVLVTINGLTQAPLTTYNINGNVILFTNSVEEDELVDIRYLGEGYVMGDQQFYGTNSVGPYDLITEATSNSVVVTVNGLTQAPGVTYNVSGATITFASTLDENEFADIRFLATGSPGPVPNSGYGNTNVISLLSTGVFSANIVPSGNSVYSLGSNTHQWNDLWLSNSTMYMNGVPISVDGSNTLTVAGQAVVTSGSNGFITVSGVSSTGVVNATYFVGDGSFLTGVSTYGNRLTNNGFVFNLDDTGNVAAPGDISAIGNITGNYFIGNGSGLTGVTAVADTGNIAFNGDSIYDLNGIILENADLTHGATAALLLPANGDANSIQINNTYGNILFQVGADATITGQLSFNNDGVLALTGSASVSGGVQANGVYVGNTVPDITHAGQYYFYANSTGAVLGQWAAQGITLNSSGIDISGSAGVNIYGVNNANVNIGGGGTDQINIANTLVSSNTITATYFYGDGSNLTGLPATYGNTDVANYLPTYSGNLSSINSISASGNIEANGFVSITGNVRGGNINTVGRITATGNVYGNYFIGNGSALTGVTVSYGNTIAIGYSAGANPQGSGAVAIGPASGGISQSPNAIAIGQNTGYSNQRPNAIGIGAGAAQFAQGPNAVAIGYNAGYVSQGNNAVAIGYYAGYSAQGNNSIVLSTSSLNGNVDNAFFVNPIRNNANTISNVLVYNTTTKEVAYANALNLSGRVSASILNATSLVQSPALVVGDGGANFGTGTFTVGNISVTGATVSIDAGNINANGILTDNYYYANGTPVTFGGGSGNSSFLANSTATMTLGTDGTLLTASSGTPANFVVNNTTPDIDLRNGSGTGLFTQSANATIRTAGTYNWDFGSDGNLSLAGDIIFPDGSFQGTAFVGIANSANAVSNTTAAVISVGSVFGNVQQWTFGNDGNLTVPGAINGNVNATVTLNALNDGDGPSIQLLNWDVANSAPSTVFEVGSDNVYINTNVTGNTPHQWTFDNTGNFYSPGNIISNVFMNNGNVNISANDANAGITFTVAGNKYGNLTSGVALGYLAGNSGFQPSGVAIGTQAGQTDQGYHAIAIGWRVGENSQGNSAISIGENAGFAAQGEYSVAIGTVAARQSQQSNAVAIGTSAGYTSQGANSVAIGYSAALSSQGINSVAIGVYAANVSQGSSSVAVGGEAGQSAQGINSVAVGVAAGAKGQGNSATAFGSFAGQYTQGNFAVALGSGAAYTNQGVGAIAIGADTATINQGQYSIAIGAGAVTSSNVVQANNSIILDATGLGATPVTNSGLYIDPVRNDTGNVTNAVYYNTSTKEITYGPAGGGSSVAEAAFSIQTSNFTANVGGRYGVNTSGGAVTATLPATPTSGQAVFFADAGGAYATNNLTIDAGTANIMGGDTTMVVSTNNQSVGLFWNGTTWRIYNAG